MRIALGALGELGQATCSKDPCGFFDWIWTSDECRTYLQGCDPTDPRAGTSLLHTLGQGAGTAVAETTSGVGAGLTSNPVSTGVLIIAGLALVALAAHQL